MQKDNLLNIFLAKMINNNWKFLKICHLVVVLTLLKTNKCFFVASIVKIIIILIINIQNFVLNALKGVIMLDIKFGLNIVLASVSVEINFLLNQMVAALNIKLMIRSKE